MIRTLFKYFIGFLLLPLYGLYRLINWTGLSYAEFLESDKHKGVRYFWKLLTTLASLYVLFFVDLGFQPWFQDSNGESAELEYKCDNNYDVGCSFDFDAQFIDLKYSNGYSKEYRIGFKVGEDTPMLAGVTPLSSTPNSDYRSKIVNVPVGGYTTMDYEVIYNNEKIELKGKILDLEDGTVLCNFDGDSFWTNECHVSWNKKDDLGMIEIVDKKNQFIRLQVQYQNGVLAFKGFFEKDGKYYAVADSIYQFDTFEELMPVVKSKLSKPTLKHFSIDSYGKLASE